MKTMNKLFGLGLIGLIGLTGPINAQQAADSAAVPAPTDSVIERTVTVEREFQPTVKAAGKLAVKPEAFEPKMEAATVEYSEFSSPLSIEKNVQTLGYASTAFNRPYSPRGFLRGGVGHTNTMLDFNYRVDNSSAGSGKRKSNEGWLDLHAQHFAQWGRKMLEKSSLGLDYTYGFDKAQLYFSVDGGNEYFAHYYRYIDTLTNRFYPGTKMSSFSKSDFQTFWDANAKIGVENVPGADILYRAETGYEGFFIADPTLGTIMEHQVHSRAMFDWSKNDHHVGLEADVKNRFYTGTTVTSKHQIHLEPYYAYEGKRIRVHAGVNFDLGLGNYDLPFGASPNVLFEADITKTWLTFFLTANGQLAAEGMREELREHRYLDVQNLVNVMDSGCCAAYTPVDAVAGLRFKPLPTLLFDIHAGYAYTFNEHILGYNEDEKKFFHVEQDQQTVKIGGSLHYHYQDIFTMEVGGDYYLGPSRELTDAGASSVDLEQGAWSNTVPPYGKYGWMIHARFDGRINRHWSLYSDNYLYGKRTALIIGNSAGTGSPLQKRGERQLKRVFDLNLGVEYTYNDRLAFFAQLNNYLGWTADLTADVLFATPAQGVNCLLGVSWNF